MTDQRPVPASAMVLAAGLGLRMRPLTDVAPKPLIKVAGKALIDWGLEALSEAGVTKAVVNIHYLPDMLIEHLATLHSPKVLISDERDELLDSGGGIVKALPLLGDRPFFILNADTFWIDHHDNNLLRLAQFWDASQMDIVMLLADPSLATGHSEKLDFVMDKASRLQRAGTASDGYIYAGVAIIHPRIFAGMLSESHSLNIYFDRAIDAGRLFGLVLDGHWVTVGTPDAIAPAEIVLEDLGKTIESRGL